VELEPEPIVLQLPTLLRNQQFQGIYKRGEAVVLEHLAGSDFGIQLGLPRSHSNSAGVPIFEHIKIKMKLLIGTTRWSGGAILTWTFSVNGRLGSWRQKIENSGT